MEYLKNITAVNKIAAIRLISPDDFVVGGQPTGQDDQNDNNAHLDLACTLQFGLNQIATNATAAAKLVTDHNADALKNAHTDIRALITTNKNSITALTSTVATNATAAAKLVTDHNADALKNAHTDIRALITTNKNSITALTSTVATNATAAAKLVTDHNADALKNAHTDIRALITTNKNSITALTSTVATNATAAAKLVTDHNADALKNAHTDIRALITTNKNSITALTTTVTTNATAAETALTTHNTNITAHTDIRTLIKDETTRGRNLAYAICPVGSVMTSFSATRPPKYWLPLNGEWFDTTANVELYNYGKACVPPWPITTGKMQLPDMRGTVPRMQNLGRFSDVAEIGLGQYQADATQRVSALIDAHIYWQHASGACYGGNPKTGKQQDIATTETFYHSVAFDNSITARTAAEDRVKATGVCFYIFAGLGSDYK